VITVTLVAPRDGELENLIRKSAMQVTHTDGSGLASLAAASARQPDVVVLDLRGTTEVPPVIPALKRQHPQTGIVLVTTSLEPALLLEAMRAGVNELVCEPLTQADLEKAIHRVVRQRLASTGRVFAVVGAKGGVGATTVAVNIATTLGSAGKPDRTLLMDLHQTGGDAAVFLGVEPRFSILDAQENIHRLDLVFLKGLVTQVTPHVDLLASSDRSVASHVDVSTIRTVIDAVTSAYRFTVLDVPRSDGAALDALDRVSTIIVVANQELATVKSTSRLAASLRQRYGRDKVVVVLSRSDRRADIGHADVERVIGMPVAHTFPSDYRTALQALNKGRPVALDNHNELSSSFRRFALQLAGLPAHKESDGRSGLLGRLTGGKGR
jgi:pilus assembly protein CpaE